jgi:hypothetical protein
MHRFLIGVISVVLLVPPVAAQAGTIQSEVEKQPDGVTVELQRRSHVAPKTTSHRRARGRRCSYTQGPVVYKLANDIGLDVQEFGRPGRWVTVTCRTPGPPPEYTYDLRYIPLRSSNAAEAALDLVEEARRQLQLPEPEINMSPPASADSVVNLPVFLWVPTELWQPEEATAEIPGVVVSVKAEPQRVVWDMGDGGQVECLGPGEPWDPSVSEEAQPSSCRYTYRSTSVGRPDERFPVTATIYWRASWTVEGAPGGGDLGEIARSSTTSVRVAQIQTVNIH